MVSLHVFAFVTAAAWGLSEIGWAQAFDDQATRRDPTGESAYYEIDRSGGRTSPIVRDGHLIATVPGAMDDMAAYRVDIDYTLRLQLLGIRTGRKSMAVDEVYFTPEFLEQLRVDGEYIGERFKIRHLGFADATNIDGSFYPNCDKIYIYDIETLDAPFMKMALALFGLSEVNADQLQDITITAHVSYGIPVLGAVKMDLTGVYQGKNVKAGADYR